MTILFFFFKPFFFDFASHKMYSTIFLINVDKRFNIKKVPATMRIDNEELELQRTSKMWRRLMNQYNFRGPSLVTDVYPFQLYFHWSILELEWLRVVMCIQLLQDSTVIFHKRKFNSNLGSGCSSIIKSNLRDDWSQNFIDYWVSIRKRKIMSSTRIFHDVNILL